MDFAKNFKGNLCAPREVLFVSDIISWTDFTHFTLWIRYVFFVLKELLCYLCIFLVCQCLKKILWPQGPNSYHTRYTRLWVPQVSFSEFQGCQKSFTLIEVGILIFRIKTDSLGCNCLIKGD